MADDDSELVERDFKKPLANALRHRISGESNWQASSWDKQLDHLHSSKQVLRHKSAWVKPPRDSTTREPAGVRRVKSVRNKLRLSTAKKVTNTVKTVTLRQSFEIQRMLNFTEL